MCRCLDKEAYLLLLSSDSNDDVRNELLLIDLLPPLHVHWVRPSIFS
jgi:hypothetical protein